VKPTGFPFECRQQKNPKKGKIKQGGVLTTTIGRGAMKRGGTLVGQVKAHAAVPPWRKLSGHLPRRRETWGRQIEKRRMVSALYEAIGGSNPCGKGHEDGLQGVGNIPVVAGGSR